MSAAVSNKSTKTNRVYIDGKALPLIVCGDLPQDNAAWDNKYSKLTDLIIMMFNLKKGMITYKEDKPTSDDSILKEETWIDKGAQTDN